MSMIQQIVDISVDTNILQSFLFATRARQITAHPIEPRRCLTHDLGFHMPTMAISLFVFFVFTTFSFFNKAVQPITISSTHVHPCEWMAKGDT